MPPQRASATLSSEEQRKLQQDLISARNRVSGEPANTDTPKPGAASDKNP
jgi:hypothetical protein